MSLTQILAARIQQNGPISVADYMTECLLHPEHGYYTIRDPLGASGDFVTAPEISQMFGELIGLSIAQAWLDQGSPAPFILTELGPGRGTLMADLLRATKSVPGFHDAAHLCLVEASPTLRASQRAALAGHGPQWFDTVEQLPGGPLFLVANEFFDALPVRQYIRDGAAWRERRVGVQDQALSFGLAPLLPQAILENRLADTQDGDLVEICEAATAITSEVAGRIARHGGVALIIDYGDWRSLGDTLQALRGHKFADVLADPGEVDLTTHVDFEAMTSAAKSSGCAFTRLTPQGVFLERLGITNRAQILAAPLQDAALNSLVAAHQRLTHPKEMGNLFKVLGLYPPEGTPPPGLDA